MNKWVSVAVVVAFGVGCGGNDKKPGMANFTTDTGDAGPTGGSRGTGGTSGTSQAGSSNTAGTTGNTTGGKNQGGATPGGASNGGVSNGGLGGGGGTSQVSLIPTVTIISPKAASNPATDPVIVDSPVEVQCVASKAAASAASPIAPSTVTISMTPSSAGGGSSSVGGAPSTGGTSSLKTTKTGSLVAPDTYSASFAITDVPSGKVTFTCSASDTASPANTNSDTISTYIDHGPTISNVIPAPKTAFPIQQSEHFEFQVTPQVLAVGDTGADIDPNGVSLSVSSVDVPVIQDPSRPGYYTAEVNFNSAAFSTLQGNSAVSITASNKRSPKPVQSVYNYYIYLDGAPPTVKINSPAGGTVIGNKAQLAFTVIDDLSGVDPTMVSVTLISDKPTTYKFSTKDAAWSVSTNPLTNTSVFTFNFDNSKFDQTIDQVAVSVSAADLAGNKTTSQTIFYYIDKQPPFVSLDPPQIRIVSPGSSSATNYCTVPFDPLGTAMPNQGMVVYSHEIYRAFAWDVTNGLGSAKFLQFAGIDPTKVHLFLQPDPTQGIIHDTNSDGICDSVTDAVAGMVGQPNLYPIGETGAGDQNPKDSDFTTAPDVHNYPCQSNANNPPRLCVNNASDMTVVVHQLYGGQTNNNAAVYGIQVDANTQHCTGLDWNIKGLVQEGWFCLAAEATDGTNNTGVSAPLALCYDDETTAFVPPCAAGKKEYEPSATTPPSCIADGCTPPSNSPPAATDTTSSIGYYVQPNYPDPAPFYVVYTK